MELRHEMRDPDQTAQKHIFGCKIIIQDYVCMILSKNLSRGDDLMLLKDTIKQTMNKQIYPALSTAHLTFNNIYDCNMSRRTCLAIQGV